MRVAFLDLAAATRELSADLSAAAERVLGSGTYIGGAEVEAFEQAFAAASGAQFCAGAGNGLDALQLALLAVGVGPGDEVIVPAHTFIATWLAVSRCGARPVPVEPDAATCNIDAARIEQALSPRTRAIVPVHLYGQPADMDPILAVGRRHGVPVVADAAQAHGARYRNRALGALGDAVAWSFYPAKNLGAFGDAGAVTTSRADIAERVRLLRNYGSREKYVHDVRGVNSRLDPLQAALLRVKLEHLASWNARRSDIAARYRESLAAAPIALPGVPDWAEPAWHLFVVRSPDRDRIRRALADAGIETGIHYPIACHRQGAYAGESFPPLPGAAALADEVLSLPIGPHLGESQADAVIDAVLRATQ